MMISGRMFSEWMDAVFPDWYSLAAGLLLGAFGVLALSLLVLGLAPHLLFMWMPVIAFFCGASSGYKLKEKQNPEKTGSTASRRLLLPASGLGPAAGALIIQNLVDSRIFGTETSMRLAAAILAFSIAGAVGGGLLRNRYEKITRE
ncbi:MAG: hypothetical protein ACOC7W_04155 [Desulfosalsimonas sp.]